MADASDLNTRSFSTGTYGRHESMEINFTMANGDGNPSTHRGARLPAGIRPIDWHIIITDASNASVTANIGLKSVSGTNQDDSVYFASAQSLAALATVRKTNQKVPITLAQEMYAQLVVGGAAVTESVAVLMVLEYQIVGTS